MKHGTIFSAVLLLMVLAGCNTTKFVPQDKYLLNKAKIKIVDTKTVSSSELTGYLRQKQNTEILGFWKLQLHIYDTAPSDTTSKANKWFANNAHKMGEAPVIYDEDLTRISMDQLRLAMANRGYFNATVDTAIKIKKRKVNLTYLVTANQPYNIRHYDVQVDNDDVRDLATGRGVTVTDGQQFNSGTLDGERERIASAMHNRGYFYFDKAMLEYSADSAFNSHEMDVTLTESPVVATLSDTALHKLNTKYKIRKVCFHIDYDPSRLPEGDSLIVETDKYGNEYSYVGKRFIRNNTLRENCRIRPGDMYREWRVERTYAYLNALAAIKYVDISFDPVGEDELDCHIVVSRSKLNNFSVEAEGTYSAGDWGVAGGLGYENKNIFKGAEVLTLNGRVSYEWRQNGGNALEAKAEAGLTFPNQLKLNIAYNYQQRPDEYTRTIANAGLYYTVPRRPNSRWTHRFNLIDISYVYLPWMSAEFDSTFIKKSSVLRASYEDHFILDWSYSGSYSSYNSKQPERSYLNFSYTIETAGNFLYAISRVAHLPQDSLGAYTIFHIPFAQYAKADVNLTYHQRLVSKHQLVYHMGIGVVCPYLNAQSVPFEKRYFSGGSNSVRGWQARTLGPGGFRSPDKMAYDLQTGDIRLDLNLEYRYKVLSFLELAAFFDAGNIWTIRDYESQPNGVFLWNEFYKQIAMSYGVGVRLDFSILIFRVDFGVKLYDPSRLYGDLSGTQWRTVPNGLCWKDDMTFHFAIGYPF